MARIRTVKPDFWEDEGIGLLSRDARLLFIACFNFADDEGLLRWNPSYISASAFMYDNLDDPEVAKLMDELVGSGMVFAYTGGIARQRLAVVVNFRKHQKVNRPQPSKLPPPDLGDRAVQEMYARRDGWKCHLCSGPIPAEPVSDSTHALVIARLVPRAQGGSDHPTNVRAAHRGCVEGDGDSNTRGSRSVPNSTNSQTHGDIHSLNDSVNHSRTNSPLERKGRGEGKEEEGKRREEHAGARNTPTSADTGGRPALSPIPLDWKPTQEDIRAAQSARAEAGHPHLTDAQLADVTRKYVRRMRADERRSRNWSTRWQEWAERERVTPPPATSANDNTVVPFPAGRPLSGTDAAVAGWAAIGQQFAALETQQTRENP